MRRVEIAGGGIGGMVTALVLARHGWHARVHERSDAIREAGAGIYIRNNSIEVLEEFGLFERLAPLGTRIERWGIRDAEGRTVQEWRNTGHSRLFVFPRQALIDVLHQGALEAGVQVRTSCRAVAAEPGGVLVLESGERLEADLVVAADGDHSALRDALIRGAAYEPRPTSISRHFLPGRALTPEPISLQYWSGRRRVGITPAGPDRTYVFTVCPSTDEVGRRLPLDPEDWGRHFPALRRAFESIAAAPVTQYRYAYVRCPRWHARRVAIVGDAAHGLPPTLGQGAGLTIMNARALARALDRKADVEAALEYWESEVRFISDATQRWSAIYDWFSREWPTTLEFARPLIVKAFGLPFLNDRMRIADRGLVLTALHH